MGFLRRIPRNDHIPVHPHNIANKDWIVLLEAGTIVGPTPEKIRVARTLQERKIVKKYDFFLRKNYFVVVEGFNPRIHSVYFCPQLYRYDQVQKFVPLQGEEIGRLIAQAVEAGVTERCPWYEPSEQLPKEPPINQTALTEFDTLVVELPNPPATKVISPQPLLERPPT